MRSGSIAHSPNRTRESSPANSVFSLASDLGIPPEIVSAGGGVNLAAVAPPSADVLEDIKPAIPTESVATPQPVSMPTMPPSASSSENPADLSAENAALRWRVGMLENIVKQAATFFSACNAVDGQVPPVGAAAMFNNSNTAAAYQPSPAMEATLSPSMFPSIARDAVVVSSPLNLQSTLPTTQTSTSGDVVSSLFNLSNPLARHPAVVATLPAVSSERRGVALQRARGPLTGINLDLPANQRRLSDVARVIVALAKLRGWTSARSSRTSAQVQATRRLKSSAARRRTAGSVRALRRPNGTRR